MVNLGNIIICRICSPCCILVYTLGNFFDTLVWQYLSFGFFRLCLFWCKTISGNDFTPHHVFGCTWKIEYSGKQFQLTVCFMALTWKIFYISIFTTNDFRTQTHKEREREREREHEERLERVRSG